MPSLRRRGGAATSRLAAGQPLRPFTASRSSPDPDRVRCGPEGPPPLRRGRGPGQCAEAPRPIRDPLGPRLQERPIRDGRAPLGGRRAAWTANPPPSGPPERAGLPLHSFLNPEHPCDAAGGGDAGVGPAWAPRMQRGTESRGHVQGNASSEPETGTNAAVNTATGSGVRTLALVCTGGRKSRGPTLPRRPSPQSIHAA